MKKIVNHVGFVLDSSGSMDVYKNAVVKAFNESAEAVRSNALKEKQVTTVSMWTFGEFDSRDGVKEKFFNRPVTELDALTTYGYQPYGQTPLYDAVRTAISTLRHLDRPNADTSFLLLVKTDGAENASRTRIGELVSLMREVNATDRWTIAFLLPPGAKAQFCRQTGIPEGNVREWEGSDRGIREATVATTQGISSYYASRSAGHTATKSFYSDLSGVKPTQVKRALDDIADNVKIFTVAAEVDISEFVEKKTRKPYRKGSAFYQLTKPELIQETKELLVMEKGKSAVYGGEDARSVLGIPEGRVKIKPGNHANYDLFVQSTSSNRKLVRGTKLVVRA